MSRASLGEARLLRLARQILSLCAGSTTSSAPLRLGNGGRACGQGISARMRHARLGLLKLAHLTFTGIAGKTALSSINSRAQRIFIDIRHILKGMPSTFLY
jgi:hypothetical protein